MTSARDQLWVAGQRFYEESGEEFRQQCVELFRALDSNGDGRVSMAELEAAMRQPGPGGRDAASVNAIRRVRRLFAAIDQNGDGELDFDECKALCFVFRWGRMCDACGDLILAGGATCLHCSSASSASSASSYDHHHHHHHHRDRLARPLDLCARCLPSHPPAHVLRRLPPLIRSPRYDPRYHRPAAAHLIRPPMPSPAFRPNPAPNPFQTPAMGQVVNSVISLNQGIQLGVAILNISSALGCSIM